jgi:hypothetical protein
LNAKDVPVALSLMNNDREFAQAGNQRKRLEMPGNTGFQRLRLALGRFAQLGAEAGRIDKGLRKGGFIGGAAACGVQIVCIQDRGLQACGAVNRKGLPAASFGEIIVRRRKKGRPSAAFCSNLTLVA